MKKIYYILSALFLCLTATSAQEAGKTVVIKTNVGTMKAILYDDVPNHTRTFIERAKRGDFNGTLFTRVLPEFMIQGGAPDSKNAPAGAKCGFGDPSAEIPPEINEKYFHKKGALAAPRQPDDINPQKKSDMSQFFIVQGKVYRETELDTLERTANYPARQKALKEFYAPVRAELNMIKMSNKREYQKRLRNRLRYSSNSRAFAIYGRATEGLYHRRRLPSSGRHLYDLRGADGGVRRSGSDRHPAERPE